MGSHAERGLGKSFRGDFRKVGNLFYTLSKVFFGGRRAVSEYSWTGMDLLLGAKKVIADSKGKILEGVAH